MASKCQKISPLLIALCALIVLNQPVYGQATTDKELWTGATIKYDLNDKWRLELEEEGRFDQDFSNLKTMFTEVGARRTLGKRWTIKANYRFSYRPTEENKGRFNLDLGYDRDLGSSPFTLDYRLRTQTGKTFGATNRKTEIRNRLQLKTKITKYVKPYVGAELLYSASKLEFRQYRLTGGVEFRITKRLDFEAFYHYQQEFNVSAPELQHIVGLGLAYEIKRKKSK